MVSWDLGATQFIWPYKLDKLKTLLPQTDNEKIITILKWGATLACIDASMLNLNTHPSTMKEKLGISGYQAAR
jgi:hypothetical protein